MLGAGVVGLLGVAACAWAYSAKASPDEPCDPRYGCIDAHMVAVIDAAEENTNAALKSFDSLVEAAKRFEAGSDAAQPSSSIREACLLGRERCVAILEQLSAVAGPTVTNEMRLARKAMVASLMAAIGDDQAAVSGAPEWTLAKIERLVRS